MDSIDLKKILSKINVKADWVGLREVNETTTYRVIRDSHPEEDSTFVDHGIMVEVLKNGQFAYAASSDMSVSSVQEAINKATMIAESSLNNPLYNFSTSVRPSGPLTWVV